MDQPLGTSFQESLEDYLVNVQELMWRVGGSCAYYEPLNT